MKTLTRLAAFVAVFLALALAPPAPAYTVETHVYADEENAVSYGPEVIEQGGKTVWYFKLSVTGVDTGSVEMHLQSYDVIAAAWDSWGDGCSVAITPSSGQCVMIFFGIDAPDHANLVNDGDADVDTVWVYPVPGKWRVKITPNDSAVWSGTVTHWRY
jgi:hypothetical protein